MSAACCRSGRRAARTARRRASWPKPCSFSRGLGARAVPARADGGDLRARGAGQQRRVRRPAALRRLLRHAGAGALGVELGVGVAGGGGDHGAGGVRLRLRADAQLHAVQGHAAADRADPAARAVAAAGDLVHPVVRQPGRAERADGSASLDLRRAGHHPVGSLQLLPARADDPDRGAGARRRAAVRGGRRARHAPPAPLLHHHPAGLQVRPAVRGHGGVHLHHQRLRRAQGDRRQLQRARRRRVQAGDRPAQLLHRRGGRPAAAGALGGGVRHRLGGAPPADRQPHGALGAVRARSRGRCSTT